MCPNRAHSSHTYVSKWLFSRSYTSTLLHCFAKCSALFWCFERILQSAPHSMTSRTMSEFPLLQACVGSKGVKITQPWSVSVPLSWEFSIEKDPWVGNRLGSRPPATVPPASLPFPSQFDFLACLSPELKIHILNTWAFTVCIKILPQVYKPIHAIPVMGDVTQQHQSPASILIKSFSRLNFLKAPSCYLDELLLPWHRCRVLCTPIPHTPLYAPV